MNSNSTGTGTGIALGLEKDKRILYSRGGIRVVISGNPSIEDIEKVIYLLKAEALVLREVKGGLETNGNKGNKRLKP